MGRFMFLAPSLLIGLVAVIYLLSPTVTHGHVDIAGATMLAFFAIGAGFFSWILIPTFGNEGPTAPMDPDFEDPGR